MKCRKESCGADRIYIEKAFLLNQTFWITTDRLLIKLWNRTLLLALLKDPFPVRRCKMHHKDDTSIFLQPQL